jgi:hypothetical protein
LVLNKQKLISAEKKEQLQDKKEMVYAEGCEVISDKEKLICREEVSDNS